MKENTYRAIKKPLLIAAAVFIAVLIALTATAQYAGSLLLETLGGRRIRETEAHVTHFSLREQMMQAQTDTRVRGFLSVAQQEEVMCSAQRGMLRASLFSPIGAQHNAPWALVFHGGLGTDRDQVMDVACELSLAGYRVLTPDLYAHGASDGAVSSLGLVDAQDVQTWVQWILLRDPKAHIVLFGQDEGGAAVLLAAAQGLPPQVCAAAADSAYRSVKERMLHLMESSGSFDALLLCLAYRMEHGIDAGEGELMQRLGTCELPLLLLHGTGDADVPAWHSEDLAAAGKNVKLVFAEGAAHGMARYADSEKYYGELLGFYRQALEE